MDPLNNTAVTYEPLPWNISPAAAYVRAAQQQQGNYRAAISADIADLTVNLPSDVLADAEDASREATRFDAGLGGEIAPFASVLLRTESAASSNIENLTASARAIAEAELPGARTTANAQVIVANTAAMVAAINLADNVDAHAILAMHKALMRERRPEIRRPVARRASLDRRRHPRSARRDLRAPAPQPRRSSHRRLARLRAARTTSPYYPRSHWHTRNSKRSTPSPTAMVAPAGH